MMKSTDTKATAIRAAHAEFIFPVTFAYGTDNILILWFVFVHNLSFFEENTATQPGPEKKPNLIIYFRIFYLNKIEKIFHKSRTAARISKRRK